MEQEPKDEDIEELLAQYRDLKLDSKLVAEIVTRLSSSPLCIAAIEN
jgi:hypothetical protein